MSPLGRPKGEPRSAQQEGAPASAGVQFPPDVLAFFTGHAAAAQQVFLQEGRMPLLLDGAACPTGADFTEQLARAVRLPGPDRSLNVLCQALGNLDWLGAAAFGICIARADLLFAQGNRYMWQYLLEMAHTVQRNVDALQRPSVRWLLQTDRASAEALQVFLARELGYGVPLLPG